MSQIQTKHSRLGVEVLPGCDLRQITEAQVRELKEALRNHGVVVVKQQNLTASQLEEFARETFGDIMFGGYSLSLDPEISPDLQSKHSAIIGNPKGLDQEQSSTQKAAWQWHHDKDGVPRTPGLKMNALYVVMLYGVKVPPQGLEGHPHTTDFLDMVEAYNNLEAEHRQQLEQMSMYHLPPFFSKQSNDQEIPKKLHPIGSTHQVTGTKGLYLGSGTAVPVGMEDKPGEAKAFWQDLFQTVLDRTPVYSHIWEPGEIIFWDNSQVMHRGNPYDSTKYQRIALRLEVVDNLSL